MNYLHLAFVASIAIFCNCAIGLDSGAAQTFTLSSANSSVTWSDDSARASALQLHEAFWGAYKSESEKRVPDVNPIARACGVPALSIYMSSGSPEFHMKEFHAQNDTTNLKVELGEPVILLYHHTIAFVMYTVSINASKPQMEFDVCCPHTDSRRPDRWALVDRHIFSHSLPVNDQWNDELGKSTAERFVTWWRDLENASKSKRPDTSKIVPLWADEKTARNTVGNAEILLKRLHVEYIGAVGNTGFLVVDISRNITPVNSSKQELLKEGSFLQIIPITNRNGKCQLTWSENWQAFGNVNFFRLPIASDCKD